LRRWALIGNTEIMTYRRSRGGGVRGIRGLQQWSTGGTGIAGRIKSALTPPVGQPSKVRTLADMSDEEIARLEVELGATIRRPR
jgi:hypothetical protein